MGIRFFLMSAILLVCGGVQAEMLTLNTPGGSVRGEVIRMTKSEVVLKTNTGKDKFVPVAFLKPKEVYACRKQLLPPDDAKAHFELGEFCTKNGLKDQAELMLLTAKRLDEKGFGAKVDALLKADGAGKPSGTDVAQAKAPEEKAEPKTGTTDANKQPKDPKKESKTRTVRVKLPDGSFREIEIGEDGKMVRPKRNIPPRSPEDMKKFLDKRLQELKTHCSGSRKKGEQKREWTLEETKHYYIFSNLKPELKARYKFECEQLFKLLSDILDYKEGGPLWNNKCPIYMPSNRDQFTQFAVNVDKKPGAAQSGGYFSHQGRQVHIVVPMLARWASEAEKLQIRRAKNTLCHEGTHAFLQLVGPDANIRISKWIHEGMAQFIEFWSDPKNNEGLNRVRELLRRAVNNDSILSWKESDKRPYNGTDTVGYAFAWSRIVFLYHAFPNKRKLPNMIKLIKEGKSEKEAMEEALGHPVEKLEEVYRKFMRDNAKKGFRGLGVPN